MINNNRLVIRCCYVGMLVQAIIINLAPVLFIPLKEQLHLSYEQIGRLVLINFTTQLFFDLVCGAFVNRVGARRFVITANLLAAAGMWMFAWLPGFMGNPYDGLVIGTFFFAAGCGLLELMLSSIVNAVPSDQKAQNMAISHSFYAWGQMGVMLISTLLIFVFGAQFWPWIVLIWSLFPLANAFGFYAVKLPPFVEESKRMKLRSLMRQPAFIVAVLAMGLGGATEVSINQWISAFAEKGLGLPKIYGDLGGVCLFAAALGVGRVWFGLRGEKINLHRALIAGTWLSVVVYLVASLSPWPYVSLAACVVAGFGVSLLWPGMLSLSSARFPLAGASMFAMMAASGDTGAAVGPWIVGAVADLSTRLQVVFTHICGRELTPEQLGLRTGLLLATVYPVLMIVLLYWLKKESQKKTEIGGEVEQAGELLNKG